MNTEWFRNWEGLLKRCWRWYLSISNRDSGLLPECQWIFVASGGVYDDSR